jgi:hypothetical protein
MYCDFQKYVVLSVNPVNQKIAASLNIEANLNHSGGGVVVAVHKKFQSFECSTIVSSCEEKWVKIVFDNFNLFVCGVYLPHTVPIFVSIILTLLRKLLSYAQI